MATYYEDFQIGRELSPLKKGPMSSAHIMRWSAAIENWHRIHYDQRFAVEHDGLPDILVNGSWKQHVLVQLVTDGLGPAGWLWKLKFRYKAMDTVGATIIARGEVTDKRVISDLGLLVIRVLLADQNGRETTAGWAAGVVPLREGPPVPYPFHAREELNTIEFPEEY